MAKGKFPTNFGKVAKGAQSDVGAKAKKLPAMKFGKGKKPGVAMKKGDKN